MRKIITLIVLLSCLSSSAQVQSDSIGIFAVHDGQHVRMERITHQMIKTSGFALTGMRSKLEFKGATSPNQFKGSARFMMYFGQPPADQMVNLYQFTAAYSPRNFEVARFEVKKKVRRLTGISVSILGSTVGVESDDSLSVEVTELRKNVYVVDVTGSPGEYCFMFSANGSGGFGGVYDFTIE